MPPRTFVPTALLAIGLARARATLPDPLAAEFDARIASSDEALTIDASRS